MKVATKLLLVFVQKVNHIKVKLVYVYTSFLSQSVLNQILTFAYIQSKVHHVFNFYTAGLVL